MNQIIPEFMRTHLYLILLLTGALVLTSLQCKKDQVPEKLPEITQEGKGTFGCLIGGEVFLPKGLPLNAPGLTCQYIPTKDEINIYAKNFDTDKSIYLNFSPLKKIDFFLKEKKPDSASYGICIVRPNPESENSIRYYTNNNSDTGVVNILRYDTTNHIISGTFWFQGRTDQSPDSIKKITEGRFDLKFSY